MSNSYPKGSISYLAINPVSLRDNYHLENMEILAQNVEIGNFLYAVMTNEDAIKNGNYRRIIRKMIENKDNIEYVFLVCYYAVGENAVGAQNVLFHNYYHEIKSYYDINKLLEKVDKNINVIDSECNERVVYEIGSSECKQEQANNKVKSLIKKI